MYSKNFIITFFLLLVNNALTAYSSTSGVTSSVTLRGLKAATQQIQKDDIVDGKELEERRQLQYYYEDPLKNADQFCRSFQLFAEEDDITNEGNAVGRTVNAVVRDTRGNIAGEFDFTATTSGDGVKTFTGVFSLDPVGDRFRSTIVTTGSHTVEERPGLAIQSGTGVFAVRTTTGLDCLSLIILRIHQQ